MPENQIGDINNLFYKCSSRAFQEELFRSPQKQIILLKIIDSELVHCLTCPKVRMISTIRKSKVKPKTWHFP